jgi:hypothetical protein
LSPQEMQDVRAFLEETASLSDEEFVGRIKSRKKRW